MKSSFFIKAQSGNEYLYDINNKNLIPCHPLLKEIHNLYTTEHPNDLSLHSQLKNVGFEVNEVHECIEEYKKLESLKYFLPLNKTKVQECNLTAVDIENAFFNTRQITFEVTERCSLRCVYCGYGELYGNNQTRNNKDLNINDAIGLLDSILEKKNKYKTSYDDSIYISFYGGEPLLRMNFIREIIQFIETNYPKQKCIYTITTNCLLLEKHIEYLKEKEFHILASLDGDYQDNALRKKPDGTNSFYDIYSNLKAVQEKHPDYFEENIRINAVISSRSNIETLLMFFQKEFNKTPKISPISDSGIAEDKSNEFFEIYQDVFHQINKNKNIKQLIGAYSFENPDFMEINRFLIFFAKAINYNYNAFISDKTGIKPPTGTCIPFSKKVFLTSSGSIMPCEKVGTIHLHGQMQNNKPVVDYEQLANSFNSKLNIIKHLCTGCYSNFNCSECIYSLIDNNSDKSKNLDCPSFMNEEQFALYVKARIDFLEENPDFIKNGISKVSIDY